MASDGRAAGLGRPERGRPREGSPPESGAAPGARTRPGEAVPCRDRLVAAVDVVRGLPSIAAARVLAREGLTTAGGRERGRARRRTCAPGTAASRAEAVRPRILPPTFRNEAPVLRPTAGKTGDDVHERRRGSKRLLPGTRDADRRKVCRRRAGAGDARKHPGRPVGRDDEPAASGGGPYHYRVSPWICKRDRLRECLCPGGNSPTRPARGLCVALTMGALWRNPDVD